MDRLNSIVRQLSRGELERAFAEARELCAESGLSSEENAKALLRGLNHLYAHLAPAPVHAFLRNADQALEPPLAQTLRKGMKTRLERTAEAVDVLRAMRRERLAREVRSLIRTRDLKGAAQGVRDMAGTARDDKDPNAIVNYIASTLGTLDHDQDRVARLLDSIHHAPSSFGLKPEQVATLNDAVSRQHAGLAGAGLEGREREFTRVLLQAVVDMRNRLPLTLAVGEPTDEETAAFYEELHALFRAFVLQGREDGMIDITNLLVEITPRDPRSVGPAVAGEERLFLSLNPRQKLCVVRALRRLGELPRVPALYVKFANSSLARGSLIPVVEVMGGLGRVEFYDFILSAYRNRKLDDPRFSCIDALGRIEQEAATDLLMGRLAELLSAKPFDPPKRREAEALSTALGRIARSRNVSEDRRNEIVRAAVGLIPASDTQMGLRAALDFFSYQAGKLSADLIAWAVHSVVQALWGQDQRPEFAREEQGSSLVLGFRQEMAELLVRLGRPALNPFLAAVEPYSTRYSGAFLAVAEILEKIGDARALSLLQKLALNAWMASEDQPTKYFQETYYDPADETSKPMTRDRIIHAILYTVSQIGGSAGHRYLVDTARQVRAKQLDSPGDQTSSFLMEHLMARAPEVDAEREEDVGGPEYDPVLAADNPLVGAPIEDVVKELHKIHLIPGAKRTRKILAIQEIVRRRYAEAIPDLVDQLGDKDAMVRSGAVTALQDFGAPGGREATLTLLGETLIAQLGATRGQRRDNVRALLRHMGPRREPFKSLILRAYEVDPGAGLKAELSKIIRTERLKAPVGMDEEEFAAADRPAPPPEEESEEEAPTPAGELDVRRVYFLARRAWVAGGKKGDPPEPPP
jgi:hypothetical protein